MRSVQRGGHLGKVRNKPTVEINHADESATPLASFGGGKSRMPWVLAGSIDTPLDDTRLGVRHLLRIDCKASPTQPNQDLLKMFNVFRERLTVDQKVIKIPELHIVEDGVKQPS
ncbi:hypothetical protein J6590_091961 [Homalodisca vitripennis]|nr:hypothetical protein J6590_091961 [Homalodisca vitripennis]